MPAAALGSLLELRERPELPEPARGLNRLGQTQNESFMLSGSLFNRCDNIRHVIRVDPCTMRMKPITRRASHHAVMSSTSASPNVLDLVILPTEAASGAAPSLLMMSGRTCLRNSST